MRENDDRSGRRKRPQKGAQRHAEGQHGPKAHRAFLEQLQAGPAREPGLHDRDLHKPGTGKSRLFERRTQHDEAEQNSEKNRLARDIGDHKHNPENFQVPGGSASGRATPRNRINPENPDAPTPGGAQPTPDRIG